MDNKEETPVPKPKKANLVAVRTLKIKNGVALVEYRTDMLRRVSVPQDAVIDGKVEFDDLNAGVPHGLPFEFMEIAGLDDEGKKLLAAAMHEAGVWTFEDTRNNRAAFQQAIRNTAIKILDKAIASINEGG